MKKITLLLLVASLVGCAGKPALRKDIAEFIKNFSLEAAIEQYQSGGYISTKIESKDGVTNKVEVEMEYTAEDPSHPTYQEITKTYENDELISTVTVEYIEDDTGCYISTNGVKESSSPEECGKLITKFFYKQVDIDGQYHTQGFYYGDYLKEVAAGLQQYVTIDQEYQLYIHNYSVTERNTNISQIYVVNRWGMLEENHYLMENEERMLRQDIFVHN